jgi:hypothetical protein
MTINETHPTKTDLSQRIEGARRLVAEDATELREFEGTWQPIEKELSALIAERAHITRSDELTPRGQAKALEALDGKVKAFAGGHLARTEARVKALADKLQESEDAAARGLTKVPGGGYILAAATANPTPEQLIGRREVRDLLRASGESPASIGQRYLRAIESGEDPELVLAIEGAPAAFPLIDEPTRAMARKLRIEKSPWADSIRRMRAALQAHSWLLEATRTELGRAR